jgi:hypothetical protein
MTGPYNSLKIYFDTKLYLSYFLVIFCGERGGRQIPVRERKLLLVMISATKIVYFDVNWFYMRGEGGEGVKIMCFFTLRTTRKTYLSSERFFVSG